MSVMKAIKTFHQSLKRGFDTETAELNTELDIVRINYSACVFDLKRACNLFLLAIEHYRLKQ